MIQILLLAAIPVLISGLGSLIEPPSRATMHAYGFPQNPKDSNWNANYCGGKWYQWGVIGGK
jgi:hypothetical protein